MVETFDKIMLVHTEMSMTVMLSLRHYISLPVKE